MNKVFSKSALSQNGGLLLVKKLQAATLILCYSVSNVTSGFRAFVILPIRI